MNHHHHTNQVVPTTVYFRRGQQAAQDDGPKSSGPNMAILDRTHPEFKAGYLYEWNNYVAPLKALEPEEPTFWVVSAPWTDMKPFTTHDEEQMLRVSALILCLTKRLAQVEEW